MTIGRRRDCAKASKACWETVSVRIMLPIDMKKLLTVSLVLEIRKSWDLPKRSTRSHHIIPKGSHHSVLSSAIPHNVDGS